MSSTRTHKSPPESIDVSNTLAELERLSEASRLADEKANLARAERDALIAFILTTRMVSGDIVANTTGLTQPRCVQIRKQYANGKAHV